MKIRKPANAKSVTYHDLHGRLENFIQKYIELLNNINIYNPIIPLESVKQLSDALMGYQNEVRKY